MASNLGRNGTIMMAYLPVRRTVRSGVCTVPHHNFNVAYPDRLCVNRTSEEEEELVI